MLCHPQRVFPSRLHSLFRGSSVDNKPKQHQATVVTLTVNCIQTTDKFSLSEHFSKVKLSKKLALFW